MKLPKIIFFGTPHFACEILQYLVEKKFPILAVVTQNEEKKSNKIVPSPVKLLSQKLLPDVPILEPLSCKEESFLQKLKELRSDIFVVVAFGQILPEALLTISKDCINVHASILPKYRGAAPIQRAIMAGEKVLGVSIMRVAKKLDAGDILSIAQIPLFDEDSYLDVEEKLLSVAKPLLYSLLIKSAEGKVEGMAQDSREVSYASKITKEEAFIDWNMPAVTLHNKIRALSFSPGAWAYVEIGNEKKRLKILKTTVSFEKGTPGENLVFSKEKWVVGCSEESLELLEVQLEGKKALSIREFLLGIRDPIEFV